MTTTAALRATATLAGWVAEAPRDWPDEALERAGRAMLDTVGVMLAGSGDEAPRRTLAAVARWGSGGSTIVGTPHRLPAPWAALVNGSAAHALDFDDILQPAFGHVSAVLVPAVLALGEERGATGATCLDAYLVGFEVMARLGESLNMAHYRQGWHSTITLGTPAAAVACARLIGLEASAVAAALSISTSMAAGSKLQFGSMTKPLHAGLAAKNGILAAQLAAAGVSAAAEPLEGDWGFLQHYAGLEAPGLEAGLARLGAPAAILQHGISVKVHPCCGSTHRPIDALLHLRAEHHLGPDLVDEIEALVTEIAARNLMYAEPRNEMEARFSLPYCLAVALVNGQLSRADFTPRAVQRPEIRELLGRITMRVDPTLSTAVSPGEAHDWPAKVAVRLKDGRVLHHTVSQPRGHPQSPLSDDELADKFRDCSDGVLSPSDASAALALLRDFQSLEQVGDLTRWLKGT